MKCWNQNRPSPFPGRMSQKATKPGFSFFVFILCCTTFFDLWMCAFVVLGLVFPYQPKDWLGEHVQYDLFCVKWDVKPQLNQSPSAVSPGFAWNTFRAASLRYVDGRWSSTCRGRACRCWSITVWPECRPCSFCLLTGSHSSTTRLRSLTSASIADLSSM